VVVSLLPQDLTERPLPVHLAAKVSDAILMLRCGGDEGWTQIKALLHAYHAGSDRGELRALLVEAWGPSPAMSDLRGLAARESQPPRNIRDAQAADELADLARGPRL
jgi:hypothetical protein